MTNAEKALIKDYKFTFGSEAGKRVFEDIMIEAHMYCSVHNVDNVNETMLFGGLHTLGLYIKDMRERDLGKDLKPEPVTDSKDPIET